MMWREGGGSTPEEGEGGKWFSGIEEGYNRTLHTKIGKPGCKSFCFIIFFIIERGGGKDTSEGGSGVFFFWNGSGLLHDYTCTNSNIWAQ